MATKDLTVIVFDHGDDEQLARALSSIATQIGFQAADHLSVVVLATRQGIQLPEMAANVQLVAGASLAALANAALARLATTWVTFMDARDMFFADGALLDFLHYSAAHPEASCLTFQYVVTEHANGRVSGFHSADFMNVLFCKYFQVAFLHQAQLQFNPRLQHYLTEDFASRALEVCPAPLWFNLNNYYLAERVLTTDFAEFVQYRRDFLTYVRNRVAPATVARDTVWSVVAAFYQLVDQRALTAANRALLAPLFAAAQQLPDAQAQLNTELANQRGNRAVDPQSFWQFMAGGAQ